MIDTFFSSEIPRATIHKSLSPNKKTLTKNKEMLNAFRPSRLADALLAQLTFRENFGSFFFREAITHWNEHRNIRALAWARFDCVRFVVIRFDTNTHVIILLTITCTATLKIFRSLQNDFHETKARNAQIEFLSIQHFFSALSLRFSLFKCHLLQLAIAVLASAFARWSKSNCESCATKKNLVAISSIRFVHYCINPPFSFGAENKLRNCTTDVAEENKINAGT